MQYTIAIKAEFKDSRNSCAGSDEELIIPTGVCDGYTVSQQMDSVHDNIFRISWKSQIVVPSQDLLLHGKKIFHQLRKINSLDKVLK